MTLGAGPTRTFFWVTLRSLTPAISYGTLQTFARTLAEFGAIVVVSGNMPFRTQTASVFVFAEVESGETQSAAAISILLLAAAMGLSYSSRMVQRRIALRA